MNKDCGRERVRERRGKEKERKSETQVCSISPLLFLGRGAEGGQVEMLCTNESTGRKKDKETERETERAGHYLNQHYSTRNKNQVTITE